MSLLTKALAPLYLRLFSWKFRDRHGAPFIRSIMRLEDNTVRFKDYTVFLNPQDKTATELFLTHVNADDWIWESREISLFREAVRLNEPCSALDIGANYGAYSLAAASLGREGRGDTIVAVEPNRATFACLKRSVEFNGFKDDITLVHAAVSDTHSGTGRLYADPDYSAMSRIQPCGSESFVPSAEGAAYDVPTVRMDDLLEEIGVDKRGAFVIKIDVEGSEPIALAGLEETLRSARGYLIFFEFHPQALMTLGHDPLELADYCLTIAPDVIAEIDHHEQAVKPIQGRADFERIMNECLNPTRLWADFTNIVVAKGLRLPEALTAEGIRSARAGV